MDGGQAQAPTASSLISREGVRALLRRGWDTMQIANLFGLREASVWNALGADDDK
jgi:hypothetical protein